MTCINRIIMLSLWIVEDEMKDKIKQIIADQLCISVEKVADDADIAKDLGADSLDVVELLMAFEEEFGVSISDEDATKIKTVNDVVAYIESKKI